MSVLVIAEHNNVNLNVATLHTLTAALQISEDVTLAILGFHCSSVILDAQNYKLKTIYFKDNQYLEHQLAENIVAALLPIAHDFTHILFPATTFGKNAAPRLAGALHTNQVSDCIAILDAETFLRPIYAGNAICKIKNEDKIKILTIRNSNFVKCMPEKSNHTAPNVQELENFTQQNLSECIKRESHQSTRPQLESAKIIVSGGRGLKSKENFKLLEALADKLHAAIGASRAAVDANFIDNDFQIGQTGKVVAPDLYIAIGISGAIQHIAGIKDSKTIIAINNDPAAPIFKVADYYLVGDLFEVVPQLVDKL